MAPARIRPLALPLLERRRVELETCAFCPKLCRSACPVSNAEPRETLTPWGKMSAAWMAARGDALTGSVAEASAAEPAPAWACTECFACTEVCAHRNPAGAVLVEARSALGDGSAPDAARRILSRFTSHEDDTRAAARALAPARPGAESADTALLVGCGYLLKAPAEARDALTAAQTLTGGAIHVSQRCCGLPLRLAGDAQRFEEHARAVAAELARFRRIVAVDPGCALTLRRHYPRERENDAAPPIGERVELLVEVAASRLQVLGRIPDASVGGPVRWHDPCQLGRGLGIYEAPRRVLARATGAPVAELRDSHGATVCSGAGGLVPSTMPEVAQTMAEARLAEHLAAGGGRVVTGCASSLTALRKYGSRQGVPVDDLVSYIARSLEAGRA